MDKKIILLIVAVVCIGLYFYGQHTKSNPYLKHLSTLGSLAFGLNTLLQIAQSEAPEIPLPPTKSHGKNRS